MHRYFKISIFLIQWVILPLLLISNPTYSQIGRFDQILKKIIYKQGNSYYLILHESFYRAKSESYSKGNTRSIGYNSSRITVYNLSDGKILAQKEMGVIDSTEACLVLGCTPENLWIYSKNYKSGIQSLNPLTLEKKVSQAFIYTNLKQSIGRFMDPFWQEIDKFYGFDPIQLKLIVTNEQNQKYYIDLEHYTSEKITENINLKFQWVHYLRSSAYFQDSLWKLDGFDNMVLTSTEKKSSELEFLNGMFMMEQNPKQLFLHYINLQENLTNQLTTFQTKKVTANDLEIKTKLELKLNNAANNTTSILKGIKPDDVLLQSNGKSFFIWSKNDESNESMILISKISSPAYGIFSIDWGTRIPGMFFNVSTARNSREFKQYFGDYIPESDFIQFELVDQRLILLYLGQVCCLNTENGTISWSFSIK
ncbi:MAG: hypothetical protein WCX31_20600 [Salinivirgaceae bacterium]